jgi:hypothetical protein
MSTKTRSGLTARVTHRAEVFWSPGLLLVYNTWGRNATKEARVLAGRGELCFEEEVERLRRSGKSADEIAQTMGVQQAWVEQLISQWFPEKSSGEKPATQRGSGG